MLLYFGIGGDHPVANASTRYDWQERVEHIAAAARVPSWHSLPTLVSSLILDATKEEQAQRISMQTFLDRMRYIVEASSGAYLPSGQHILIELLHRIYPSSAISATLNGVEIRHMGATELSADFNEDDNTFRFKLNYVEKGSKNRANLGKYLREAFSRASGVAGKFASVDQKNSRVQQGAISLSFSAPVPSEMSALLKLAHNVSSVIDATKIGD